MPIRRIINCRSLPMMRRGGGGGGRPGPPPPPAGAGGRPRLDAIALRREIAELMSADDIARAQREARAWMASN
ncbi:hypothetical protein [Rhodopseudomonas sp. BAL398]|uniref:hypothetical protein n=1 Tax=Rhodopseudomonas sp. BAL398 TaxID=3034676 RepID=UPI0023E1AA4D|nr:hypothetical protein [Rhodopseudomonas sp. BAL398]MDF3810248.1 hypothetical protein [Rhodopseudomonas sp. BAL398]